MPGDPSARPTDRHPRRHAVDTAATTEIHTRDIRAPGGATVASSSLRPAGPRPWTVIVPVLVGAAVAVGLGVYGRLHEPVALPLDLPGFSGTPYVKAWLTVITTALAVVQVVSALSMWGRLGGWQPGWTGMLHRWSGRLAVLVSVPVAAQCLHAAGFEYDRTRVLMHSLCGCLFYGAFVTKMLVLPRKDAPGWVLPVLGGIAFVAIVLLFLTSALWLFSAGGLRF